MIVTVQLFRNYFFAVFFTFCSFKKRNHGNHRFILIIRFLTTHSRSFDSVQSTLQTDVKNTSDGTSRFIRDESALSSLSLSCSTFFSGDRHAGDFEASPALSLSLSLLLFVFLFPSPSLPLSHGCIDLK
jgi:hypothetical protein